jgi:RNA polymerase sigma-70 factor (ECF subfamily)
MAAAEPGSIEELCSKTWKPLYLFIYFKVQNRQEAEDITQETYVKAMSHLLSGKVAPNKYIAFLKTVAHNLLRDGWRRKQRRGTTVDIDAIHPQDYATEGPDESSIQRQTLEDALMRLNLEQRTVIELRIIQGYSVAETARFMNVTEEAVRVKQHRALRKLADLLKNYD